MACPRDEGESIFKRLKLAEDKQVVRSNYSNDAPVDERVRFLEWGVSVQRPLL